MSSSPDERVEFDELAPQALAEEAPQKLEDGLALCLSGGGYRACLFHAGAILRLNELGVLSKLRRVSSVSGGSITAATLGLHWPRLAWDAEFRRVHSASLHEQLIEPLRRMTRVSIDVSSIGWGLLIPGMTISGQVAAAYDEHLFHEATLQNLPDERNEPLPPAPRFVITATNVKTGSLWRFAQPYMADYRVGIVDRPTVPLAVAVAASSAFPPFLSPLRLSLEEFDFRPDVPENAARIPRSLRAEAVLTDGGVYDNLGLEPVWKRYRTVLVSDGGRPAEDDLSPAEDWARHSRRLIDLLEHQVSKLRRRQAVNAFRDPAEPHLGTYWGIHTDMANYRLADGLPCPHAATMRIARIETRLSALSALEQERIMNWGYAICDASMRSFVDEFKHAQPPAGFPFPAAGVG